MIIVVIVIAVLLAAAVAAGLIVRAKAKSSKYAAAKAEADKAIIKSIKKNRELEVLFPTFAYFVRISGHYLSLQNMAQNMKHLKCQNRTLFMRNFGS